MTQNQGSEPVPASRTGQLISARDMAMQKFEEGMRLISEASELCGLSLSSPAELCSPTHLVFRRHWIAPSRRGVRKLTVKRGKGSLKKQVWTGTGTISKKKPLTNPFVRIRPSLPWRLLREHYSMHWLTDETPLQKVSLMFSTSLTEVSKAMPGNIQCQKSLFFGGFFLV